MKILPGTKRFVKWLESRERNIEFVRYLCQNCGHGYEAVEMWLPGTVYLDGRKCPACRHLTFEHPKAKELRKRDGGKLPEGCLLVWKERGHAGWIPENDGEVDVSLGVQLWKRVRVALRFGRRRPSLWSLRRMLRVC